MIVITAPALGGAVEHEPHVDVVGQHQRLDAAAQPAPGRAPLRASAARARRRRRAGSNVTLTSSLSLLISPFLLGRLRARNVSWSASIGCPDVPPLPVAAAGHGKGLFQDGERWR
jgi:hypothetical protein